MKSSIFSSIAGHGYQIFSMLELYLRKCYQPACSSRGCKAWRFVLASIAKVWVWMLLDQCVALAELESLLYVHVAINMLQDSCFCSTRVAEAAYVFSVDRTLPARSCSNLYKGLEGLDCLDRADAGCGESSHAGERRSLLWRRAGWVAAISIQFLSRCSQSGDWGRAGPGKPGLGMKLLWRSGKIFKHGLKRDPDLSQ